MTPPAVDVAIVERRLRLMRELLDDLRPYAEVTGARLATDRTAKHVVERVLSQLIELAAQVNAHLVAGLAGRAPATLRSSFLDVAALGVVPEELAVRLAPAAGLRNLLVHEYGDIDPEQVAAAVRKALDDLPAYVAAVARFLVTGR